MFPNFRLMIVAAVASVVALSFGFGLFAAFRVNHEPLARLPRVTAPLQFVDDNQAPGAATIASQQPFGNRFQFHAPPSGGDAAGTTETVETTATIAPATQPAAAPAADPPEQTALAADEPKVDSAPLPAPEDKSPTADASVPDAATGPTQDGTIVIATAPTMDQPPAVDEATPEPKQDGAGATVATAPTIDQPPTIDEATQETRQDIERLPFIGPVPVAKPAAKPAAKPTAKPASKVVRKVAARSHFAAKTRHARRSQASAVAQSIDQTSPFAPPIFQTAPPNTLPNGLLSGPRTARKIKKTAVGGPFVAPTGY